MKIRLNYISNSSSSSFVVLNLDKLTDEQINAILNYDKICYEYCLNHPELYSIENHKGKGFNPELCDGNLIEIINKENESDSFDFINDTCRFHFNINKEDNCIDGNTIMTNFNMEKWLKTIGVKFRYNYD